MKTAQLWRCAAGHTYRSPIPVRAVTCPECSRQYRGNPNVRAGAQTWEMDLVAGPRVDSRGKIVEQVPDEKGVLTV